MLKNLNKRKKKKGFTLIELVIVLAVLAIIALIAIPNFNKVRNDSKVKADKETCNTIQRVTEMAITDLDMVVRGEVDIQIKAPASKGADATIKVTKGTVGVEGVAGSDKTDLMWKKAAVAGGDTGEVNYEKALNKINNPQVKGEKTYKVTITPQGKSITVITQSADITK